MLQIPKVGYLTRFTLRVGARLWNSIPLDTRNKSNFSFKMSIKSTLFHILEQEKSYVEVSNAIQLPSKPNQST